MLGHPGCTKYGGGGNTRGVPIKIFNFYGTTTLFSLIGTFEQKKKQASSGQIVYTMSVVYL